MKFHTRLYTFVIGCFGLTAVTCWGQQPAKAPLPLVTAHIKSKTLQEALSEITRTSGVQMEASKEVADIKVTILVRDLRLDDMRARLAEVLHLTWKLKKIGDGPSPSYVIFRSAKDSAEERELATRGERAFRKGIDEAIGVLSLSPEDRDKLLAERPALAQTFSQAGADAAVGLLAQIPKEALDSIMDGSDQHFPSSGPPPELAAGFSQLVNQMQAQYTGPFPEIFGMSGTFSIKRVGEGADSGIAVSLGVTTETLTTGAGVAVTGTHSGEVYPESYPDHKGKEYDADSLPVNIRTEIAADTLDDMLEKVADTLHLNIIRESYRQYFQKAAGPNAPAYPVKVVQSTSTVKQILDILAGSNGCTWRKHDSVYMIQQPFWWMARQSEVTDAQLAHVESVYSKQPLTLDAMADIGKTLDEYQWGVMLGITNTGNCYLDQWQWLLRFFGNLEPAIQSYMFGADGVGMSDLREADQKRLASWIYQDQLRSRFNLPPEGVRVTAVHRIDDSGQPVVVFRASVTENNGFETLLREQTIPDVRRLRAPQGHVPAVSP